MDAAAAAGGNGQKKRCVTVTNEQRQKICAMYLDQKLMKDISEEFGIHKSTVTRIIRRFVDTDSYELKKKGGRVQPKKLNDDQVEALREYLAETQYSKSLWAVREFCRTQLGVQISVGTAFNLVKQFKADRDKVVSVSAQSDTDQ